MQALETDWQAKLCKCLRGKLNFLTACRLDLGTRRSIRRCLDMGCTGEELSRAAQRVNAVSAVRVWAFLRHIGRI